MELTIPNTPDGALVFGVAAFLLAFASTSLIALGVAALPLLSWSQSSPAANAERRQSAAPAPEYGGIASDHEVAVISAAVAAVIGAHRIVHIEPGFQGIGWQAEGRAAHHGSHAVSHSGASQRHPDNHTGNSHGA